LFWDLPCYAPQASIMRAFAVSASLTVLTAVLLIPLNIVQPTPAVLEVPSKDQPYDPSKDSILRRVKGMFGEGS